MVETVQQALAGIAVFLTIYAYIPYFKGIFAGQTKPHLFTWLVWSLVTLIAVVIQATEGGGAGTWPTAVAALLCFAITGLAVTHGSKDIKKVDWFFLAASISAIPVWLLTANPLWAAIMVTLIEIIASFPTLRKSWHTPEQEVASTYGINTIRYVLSILALASFSPATLAYPLGMVLMNGLIFLVLVLRTRAKTT